MVGNVTIEPRAWARAVSNPQIKQVRSRKSGLLLDVSRLIRAFRYERAVLLRQELKSLAKVNEARFTCSTCGVPVYLACSTSKHFFFRHKHEDGSCPAITRTGLSEAEIRAMKYRGTQESDAHKRVKELILRSLTADPRFTEVASEQTWRASEGLVGLRRPDVSGKFGNLRIAFEVQLSTTFLDVVLSRRDFYRDQGAALLWAVPTFLPNYRRMTDDDILFGNNSNVFVVDETSVAASERDSRMTLRCWYRRPTLDGDQIVDEWVDQLVSWDDLKIDTSTQTACAFDYKAAFATLKDELKQREADRAAAVAEEAASAATAEEQRLRQRAFELVRTDEDRSDYAAREEDWLDLNHDLLDWGCGLEGNHPDFAKLERMVRLIDTALCGAPVGFGHRNLAQIAHHLFDQHPSYLLPFGHLLNAYGTKGILDRDDHTGKWRSKVSQQRINMKHDPRFKLSDDEERLFAFLSDQRSRSTKAAMEGNQNEQRAA